MSVWSSYDVKASWVAVFVLFLLWWLSIIPGIFMGDRSGGSASKPEDGGVTEGIVVHEGDERGRRFKRVARHFREGVLWLLASVAIAFAAAAPSGATNSLAWIFTAIWILMGIALWFVKLPRIMNLLAFLSLILLVALISNAFAHAAGRSAAVLTP